MIDICDSARLQQHHETGQLLKDQPGWTLYVDHHLGIRSQKEDNMQTVSTYQLVHALLEQNHIPYHTLQAPDTISLTKDWACQAVPAGNLASACILKDQSGFLIALFPASHQLNLETLNHLLHRKFEVINLDTLRMEMDGLSLQPEENSAIRIIIDEALTDQEQIFFASEETHKIIRAMSDDLELLADNVLIGSRFSDASQPDSQDQDDEPRLDLRTQLQHLDKLPVMPDLAVKILRLRNDPEATVEQLVEIVALEPILSAQVIRYANSALFGQHGIDSLEDAIFRVLGFETVVHLAFGMAIGKTFSMPEHGPLNQNQFWQNAVYSAALVQKLASFMPKSIQPPAGLTYLTGLLHNLGYLVLGALFETEYFWLNKMLAAKPEIPVVQTERQLLGLTHMDLGAWLMQAWHMPEEIIKVVAEHHNPDYRGAHAIYVDLVMLADRLLKTHNMSDAETDEIPADLLLRLGLSEETVFLTMDEVLQGSPALKEMVNAMQAAGA